MRQWAIDSPASRLRALLSVALLTCPLMLAAVEQGDQHASMRPFQLGSTRETWRQLWRDFRADGGRGASGLYSVLVAAEDGKCVSHSLLNSLALDVTFFGKPFTEAIEAAGCEGSYDGIYQGDDHSLFLMFGVLGTGNRFKDGVDRYGGEQYYKNARRYVDPKNNFDPDQLDQVLNRCEGRCEAWDIVGALFAKANAFDIRGRPTTAALWRELALYYASDSRILRIKLAEHLPYHVFSLYRHAVKTADFGLASFAFETMEKLSIEGEDAKKVSEHFDSWAVSLNDGKLETKPLGAIIPLVMDTPFSKEHAGALRNVTANEIRVSVTEGEIDHVFLTCSGSDDGSSQVYLNTEGSNGWHIPSDWDDCSLILLGDEGTKVHIWEYPAGTLDVLGNLSV